MLLHSISPFRKNGSLVNLPFSEILRGSLGLRLGLQAREQSSFGKT